eukprot:6784402-Pyramimonas_sp.AAC.1
MPCAGTHTPRIEESTPPAGELAPPAGEFAPLAGELLAPSVSATQNTRYASLSSGSKYVRCASIRPSCGHSGW